MNPVVAKAAPVPKLHNDQNFRPKAAHLKINRTNRTKKCFPKLKILVSNKVYKKYGIKKPPS